MNPDPERWRSRPGTVHPRGRDRAVVSIGDLFQTHLRQFGGGLP